jgi:site-specific DNA-methyltransferase (adenine-specific)
MTARVLTGDCLTVMPTLAAGSVAAVVTSPPYAEQRARFYGGIPEADYPAWTVAWMAAVRRLLVPHGSVLLNIREHIRDGQMSDYVHRTRLALRADGWIECDELIWVKTGAPPVGHPGRPRRSWERILWFSPVRQPWCDPQANGQASAKLGMFPEGNILQWANTPESYRAGIARCPDYIAYGTGEYTEHTGHPAAYPPALAAWMARLVCPPGGVVLDPFSGSGSTGIACIREGFGFIGIERDADYAAASRHRLADAQRQPRLMPVTAEHYEQQTLLEVAE